MALLGQEHTEFMPAWHTRLDTMEALRPEALSATLELMIGTLESINGGSLEPST